MEKVDPARVVFRPRPRPASDRVNELHNAIMPDLDRVVRVAAGATVADQPPR